jgi:thioredoxin-like negative regulator of GroEL
MWYGWLFAFFLLIVGAAVGFYFSYKDITGHSPFTGPTPASYQVDTEKAKLICFGVNWCPYSKRMSAIWQNVVSKYDGKTIGGKTIEVSYEDAEANKPLAKQFNIQAYPTVKLVTKETTWTFNGGSNMSDIDAFITQILGEN